MSCDPNSNSLSPPIIPGVPVPGFGLPSFAFPQVPLPDLPFGLPESLLDLLNLLKLKFPGPWDVSGFLDDLTNSLLKHIASILNQIAPFLALYRFFQALLNMILCILEIICAYPNPFKMVKAIRRLFKRCLPLFIALFPWLALLAMIIALLLLILALIEYIIQRILAFILELLRNLKLLGQGVTLENPDATIAAAQKIAQLDRKSVV